MPPSPLPGHLPQRQSGPHLQFTQGQDGLQRSLFWVWVVIVGLLLGW
jgi:hypothetical protein